jgi:hypothetical protein
MIRWLIFKVVAYCRLILNVAAHTGSRRLILNVAAYAGMALIVAGALRLSISWGMIVAGLMLVGVVLVLVKAGVRRGE